MLENQYQLVTVSENVFALMFNGSHQLILCSTDDSLPWVFLHSATSVVVARSTTKADLLERLYVGEYERLLSILDNFHPSLPKPNKLLVLNRI